MDEIKIVNIQRDGVKFQMGNAFSYKVLGPDNGVQEVSLNYGEHAPGMEFKQHIHQNSCDIIICLSGTGVIRSGDKRIPIGPGDVIYVPAGVVHGTINTGNETLKMFGMQVPPDPALYNQSKDQK